MPTFLVMDDNANELLCFLVWSPQKQQWGEGLTLDGSSRRQIILLFVISALEAFSFRTLGATYE